MNPTSGLRAAQLPQVIAGGVIVISETPTELLGRFTYGLFSGSVGAAPAPRFCGPGIPFDRSQDFVVAWKDGRRTR